MNICVYGASSEAIEREYIREGERLGRLMAEAGLTLIFGGGATGMMGAVVRGVMEKGGYSIGIAPKFFAQEGVLYDDCSEFIFTDTMRQRKEEMERRADGFLVMPGGIGTMEEFFEIFTLKQLKRHQKPIAIFNVCGYYDPLEQLLIHMEKNHFLNEDCRGLYKISQSAESLLIYLKENAYLQCTRSSG